MNCRWQSIEIKAIMVLGFELCRLLSCSHGAFMNESTYGRSGSMALILIQWKIMSRFSLVVGIFTHYWQRIIIFVKWHFFFFCYTNYFDFIISGLFSARFNESLMSEGVETSGALGRDYFGWWFSTSFSNWSVDVMYFGFEPSVVKMRIFPSFSQACSNILLQHHRHMFWLCSVVFKWVVSAENGGVLF